MSAKYYKPKFYFLNYVSFNGKEKKSINLMESDVTTEFTTLIITLQ